MGAVLVFAPMVAAADRHLSADDTLGYLLAHQAFAGFGRLSIRTAPEKGTTTAAADDRVGFRTTRTG
jgi:hypothetical protein